MENTQSFFMLEHVALTSSLECFSPHNSATCKTSETGNMKFRTVMLTKQLKILGCLSLTNVVYVHSRMCSLFHTWHYKLITNIKSY